MLLLLFFLLVAVVRLDSSAGCIRFPEGAAAAALKSEDCVDGNRKEVADRVASLQARLGSRESVKLCLLVVPLRGTIIYRLYE